MIYGTCLKQRKHPTDVRWLLVILFKSYITPQKARQFGPRKNFSTETKSRDTKCEPEGRIPSLREITGPTSLILNPKYCLPQESLVLRCQLLGITDRGDLYFDKGEKMRTNSSHLSKSFFTRELSSLIITTRIRIKRDLIEKRQVSQLASFRDLQLAMETTKYSAWPKTAFLCQSFKSAYKSHYAEVKKS